MCFVPNTAGSDSFLAEVASRALGMLRKGSPLLCLSLKDRKVEDSDLCSVCPRNKY